MVYIGIIELVSYSLKSKFKESSNYIKFEKKYD